MDRYTSTLEIQRPPEQVVDERLLSEVDHIIECLRPDGTLHPKDDRDIKQNLTTAAQEAAMPHAVTTTEHEVMYDNERKQETFVWLGKTAMQSAESGYDFHIDDAALARVDVEVDEADHTENDLRAGIMKFFVSPCMTATDAPLGVAKQEHLAEDDAVRASWVVADKNGNRQKRVLQSLLVRHVPLQAWQNMLQDPSNPFGKAIALENLDSALSVMQVHRELEVPLGELPEGPVSMVEAVIPYINDSELQEKVREQLELYRCDQAELQRKAEGIAERWKEFECDLAKSLIDGQATLSISRYILGLQHYWNDESLAVIERHHKGGAEYTMTRELASLLEGARRKNLWTSAGVLAGSEAIVSQLSQDAYNQILQNETLIAMGRYNDMDTTSLEIETSQITAEENVNTGNRGCPGDAGDKFRDNDKKDKRSDRIKSTNSNNQESNTGPCEYTHDGCYCSPYHQDGSPSPIKVKVTAKRDKNGVAHCLRLGCGATLDSKGNAYKGLIYAKAVKKVAA